MGSQHGVRGIAAQERLEMIGHEGVVAMIKGPAAPVAVDYRRRGGADSVNLCQRRREQPGQSSRPEV